MNTIQTGIEFESIPGCVPTYLVVQVATKYQYEYFGNWQDLLPEQQAFFIAHHIAENYVENHKNDAEYRAAQRKSKLKGK